MRLETIPGYHAYRYQVSDEGKIYSLLHKRVIEPSINRGGYQNVLLSQGGRSKRVYVHRVVLEAFVGPCPEGMQACHCNGNPTDNRLENLRWDTPLENQADRYHHVYERTLATVPGTPPQAYPPIL
jgi:hypothetical protein